MSILKSYKITNTKIVMNISILGVMLIGILMFNFNKDSSVTNYYLSLSIIILNMIIVLKARKNIHLLIIILLIFYFNYSIIMGEYLAGNLKLKLNTLRFYNNGYYYKQGLFIMFIFISILALLIKSASKISVDFIRKRNNVIFFGLYILLIIIGIFFIDRSIGSSYSVQITPVYEYSFIIFIFLNYYSGKSKINEFLIIILALFFILQDFILGGRITSMQIILALAGTRYYKILNFKNILIGMILGVLLLTFVGAYRSSYTIEGLSIIGIFSAIKTDLFVQSTAVFAYAASITHIAASEIYSIHERLVSFLAFFIQIIIGSRNEFTNLGNVTGLARQHYLNYGGGLIFSHFFFWGSYFGVVVIGFIVSKIINKLIVNFDSNNDYFRVLSIIFISCVPRWYLYSPLEIFRATFILGTLLYFTLRFLDKKMVTK
jgi:hypothetical protein